MSPASVLKLDAGCSLLMREQARFDRGGIDGLAFDSLSAEAAESCSAMLWAPRPEFHSLQTTPARGLCAGMSSFERHGVHVTVLIVPPTDTAIIAKLGLDPTTMPMKPMSTKQCVSEALHALPGNRSLCHCGVTNRLMTRLIPTSVARAMLCK
jgi:hypothetical protein